MDIGLKTRAGHIASAMSVVDLLCTLYNNYPNSIIILSKGHGGLAQYVILNELGILPNKILETYAKDGGLSEHATLDIKHGIYASTGALGHGLAIGIGYAMAQPDRQVFVILGDGELDEGSTLEALRIIEKKDLKNIFPFVDNNGWQGFSKFQPFNPFAKMFIRPIYSVKGHGWGKYEDTLDSHYQIVTQEIYDEWTKNIEVIEKERKKRIKEYKDSQKDLKNETTKV